MIIVIFVRLVVENPGLVNCSCEVLYTHLVQNLLNHTASCYYIVASCCYGSNTAEIDKVIVPAHCVNNVVQLTGNKL